MANLRVNIKFVHIYVFVGADNRVPQHIPLEYNDTYIGANRYMFRCFEHCANGIYAQGIDSDSVRVTDIQSWQNSSSREQGIKVIAKHFTDSEKSCD